jgi:hypothetical protein
LSFLYRHSDSNFSAVCSGAKLEHCHYNFKGIPNATLELEELCTYNSPLLFYVSEFFNQLIGYNESISAAVEEITCPR